MFRSSISLLILVAAASTVQAQDDEENPFRPGLIATYTAGGISATRTDEVIAFDWQEAAPEARLPAGEFTAKWTGRLMTQTSGAYRLHCYVQGEVEIKLAGQQVLVGRSEKPDWIASQLLEYGFDRHELAITFRKTSPQARLALFWSGPDFRLEPIGERFLMHDRPASPSTAFERGRQLAAALRCAACHKDDTAKVIPAPALDRLTGNIHEGWLINWLSSHEQGQQDQALKAVGVEVKPPQRRMPDLQIKRGEAEAVTAWLLREPAMKAEQKQSEQKEAKAAKEREKKGEKKAKGSKGDEKPKPSAEEGEKVILTKGCLACHQDGPLGESGQFGGGDLANVFYKRSPDFLLRWLENPTAINRTHRMPVFTFNRDEMESLKLWAEARNVLTSPYGPGVDPGKRPAAVREGEKHVAAFRCANCHLVSRDENDLAAAFRPPLTSVSNWARSCSGQPEREKGRPGYHLAAEDQEALKAYYSQSRPGEGKLPSQARGRDLLVQLNCLACHQREGVDRTASLLPARLQDKLTAVAEAHDELAPLVPAMTPPALNSVGDKLHDAALADSIRRKGDPHRPYLLVQMPKFDLTDEQLGHLTAYFTATDRIPGGIGVPPVEEVTAGETPAPRLLAAGPRLVTADGLACASCHQVGSVMPSKAPLNARGPTLSMLEKRIRKEWFDRWCDNPARIVPRMEMPSVKVPVRGVLNEKIDDQLAAVWHILNTPGFEPPEPNPVRVLRLSGVPEKNERPIVIHDVFKDGDKTYLYPLVIGLPNRHNLLFDLETNRLAAWWLGDTARQRTKGKSWYWETGAKSIVEFGPNLSELSLMVGDTEVWPTNDGQFATNLDHYDITSESVRWNGRLTFATGHIPDSNGTAETKVTWSQTLALLKGPQRADRFMRAILISGSGSANQVRLRLVSPELARVCKWDEGQGILSIPGAGTISIGTRQNAIWNPNGTLTFPTKRTDPRRTESGPNWSSTFLITYVTSLPVDQYVADPPPVPSLLVQELEIAPGFTAMRLPLPDDIMPSGFAWNGSGALHLCTLKGQVYSAKDTNADALEDQLQLIADGLATPYGLQFNDLVTNRLDVAAKNGLLGQNFDEQQRPRSIHRLFGAWGHTDDYHDWAVGPIPVNYGDYYIALPCQQDQRSDAAAQYRGKVVRVIQRPATPENPRLFDVEIISSGHRFPMGMAMNREGELFVTDNQGNYNPFNELNHVKKGAHFGFINALEKEKGYQPPPLTEPAINIPHPWTRSVNGICFLDTPLAGTKPGPGAPGASLLPAKSLYGPLEGHLVGCEYDTRRLIRMSLQKIGDMYQGCAYPLSIPPADVEKGLLGPIVCAIKPTTGELYVGEIRDSGWGASNNIGQIVKIKIEPDKLPCGIAEVRATATGFTIDFFQPVDEKLVANIASYSISSYRRESTPAYGGSDLDRREEKIATATLSDNEKRVTLTLPELRAGHVYELRLKNLAPGGGKFHPDEAHYTLKQIPK